MFRNSLLLEIVTGICSVLPVAFGRRNTIKLLSKSTTPRLKAEGLNSQ